MLVTGRSGPTDGDTPLAAAIQRSAPDDVGNLAQVQCRAGRSPVMVGRSSALESLRDLIEAAAVPAREVPAVVLIAGEAGIGKTRLLQELLLQRPDDAIVLAGGAEPGGEGVAHSLIASVLGRRDLAESTTTDLMRELVERIGQRRSIVIVEDLHWADAESAAVIDRLAQETWPGMVLIGTYRPEDLSRRSPGGELLFRLERRQTVEQIRLDRLDRTGVSAILSGMFGTTPASALIEATYQRSGGNPFLIEELAGCCGDITAEEIAASRLPWSLEEAVKERLAGISAVERRVIESAAVLGPSASFDVLAAVTELSERELIDALRSLVDRNLLSELEPDEFGFRHALVRDAVNHQVLGRERRLLHQRALEALRAVTPHDLSALSRHAGGAGRFDEMVEFGRAAAAENLVKGSTFEALRLADEALQEAPDDVGLLGVATQAAWLVGFNEESLGLARRWFDAARALGSLGEEAAATRWLVRTNFELGERDAMLIELARLEHLADELGAGEDRARAFAAIAQANMVLDRSAVAIEWADRTIAEAEAFDLPSVRAQGLIERGSARVTLVGRAASAELLAAVDEAESVGDYVLVARGLNNVFDMVSLRSDTGRQLVERFRAAIERCGFDAMWTLAAREAEIALAEADMPSLRRVLLRIRERGSLSRKDLFWTTFFEGELALEEGRVADAERLANLNEQLRTEKGHDHADEASVARAFLSVAALGGAMGRSPIDLLRTGFGAGLSDNTWLERDALMGVEDAIALGIDPQLAHDIVVAGAPTPETAERIERVVSGLVHLAEGRMAEAAARLLTALADPDIELSRALLGHLRIRAAEAVLASGDHAGAKALVRQALDNELALWPGWRRDRGEALLRRLEGATPSGKGSELTPREQEVAALLTEGLTNGEVARRLYISPKTAAVHVSNILMKLNMSSRAEIAAWAVRSGLVGSAT
ncbi:MAG: LuxR C-terminal-related transcriptional regulator [Acidimicrobiia bacterium]